MKSLIIKIIIGVVATGTIATTSIIVVPKVINHIEEKRIQEEIQQDLDNIDIVLKQEELILPYQGNYNENLYENQFEVDLAEKANDYTLYERFVDSYKGGTLEITGNIDINTIGEYKIDYKVTSDKGNNKLKQIVVKVQDMMAPTINISNEIITLEKGKQVNILEGVTASDNVDSQEELTSKIQTEGTLDTNTIGEYSIKYSVKDSAGWSNEKTRTYKVIEKKEIIIGKTYRYRKYGSDYKNGYVDSTVVFKANNKVEYREADGMDYFDYTGTYTIKDGIITAKVEYHDLFLGDDSKTVKFKIQDKNTIVDTSNNITYRAN